MLSGCPPLDIFFSHEDLDNVRCVYLDRLSTFKTLLFNQIRPPNLFTAMKVGSLFLCLI